MLRLAITAEQNSHPRSIPCNGAVVRRLRKRLGLTQAQLAQRSGFSERLIRKAEASTPISLKTVRSLAVALSCDEKNVDPNVLICSPVESAKRLLANPDADRPDQAEISQATRDAIVLMSSSLGEITFLSNDNEVVAYTEQRGDQVNDCLFLHFRFDEGKLRSVKSYLSRPGS